MEEARYRSLRAVKGGLVWLRAPVAGVLGEGGADLDDDRPRPALQRFDLRKREVTELAGALDWFRVSGDGTRIVICDDDELRVIPSAHKPDDAGETVTVDLARARFQADPDALWRHAYGEAGRYLRRDFWSPDMSGVDWDGVLDRYRPLLDRIRSAADFADLLWEVLGELGTSHAYVTAAWDGTRDHTPVGQLGADLSRDAAGRWVVDRVLPGESSDPQARSPLSRPGSRSVPATSWSRWTGSRSTRGAVPGRCWPAPRASRWSSPSGRMAPIPRCGGESWLCRCTRTGGCATRTGWPGGVAWSASSAADGSATCTSRT